MDSTNKHQVTPSKIMEIGMGFWASKSLLTAVNMSLFTHLAEGELSGQDLKDKIGLHSRGLYDFLDTLVALGFLKRSGLKETSMYRNTEDSNLFLDKNKPSYIGGILEMANNRLYPFWNDLEESLKTGKPQNETKTGDLSIFDVLCADEVKLRAFLKAMGGIQQGNFKKFSQMFDFSNYTTHCDVGGAGGQLATQIAMNNEHMNCISFDLPEVGPIANENIDRIGLGERVSTESGNFLKGSIPKADVITMGNILHDWGIKDKKMLIKKAYDSLPRGGALVVIENIIDDNRSDNAFGLLMSLNMNIETAEGFDFSASDFDEWAKEIGFTKTSVMSLTGPSSAIVAIK